MTDESPFPGDFDVSEFEDDFQLPEVGELEIGLDAIRSDQVFYPTAEEIHGIHEDIIREDDDASEGILNEGQVNYALDTVEHGHFGQVPETIHEKAFTLMRLLAANHTFADGNKRTALNSTWVFYAINGKYFGYGEEIKAILKLLAVKEEMVDEEEAKSYFEEIARDMQHERSPSPLTELTFLSNYAERLDSKIVGYQQKVESMPTDQDDLDEGLSDEMMEVGEELGMSLTHYVAVADQLCKLAEEYHDELPQETLDYINTVEANANKLVTLFNYGFESMQKADDIGEYQQNMEERMEGFIEESTEE